MISQARRLDPTQTSGIVRLYAAEISRRLRKLEIALRISIVDNDALGLRGTPKLKLNEDDILPGGYREWVGDAATRQKNLALWLENAIKTGVLEEVDGDVPQWLKSYVRAAYSKGVQSAAKAVQGAEIDAAAITKNINSVLNSPFHRDALEALYQRNFAEIKGLTDQMAAQLQRVIADGLMAGQNPKAIAREISKQIGISKKRAVKIARTEVIRANAEAELKTFERFGLTDVEVVAEYVTAGFSVCPICSPFEGKVYTLAEAHGIIPQHPNCRCSWAPFQRKKQTAA